MKKKIESFEKYWLVNGRYAIYKDNGVVYDTKKGKDIPQTIFKWRDDLMTNKKWCDYYFGNIKANILPF